MPVVGPNVSTTTAFAQSSPYLGIKAGIIGEANVATAVGAQIGALYSTYRYYATIRAFRVDAIEMPACITYKVGDPERTRVSLGGGPYLGIQLDRELKDAQGNYIQQRSFKYIEPVCAGLHINVGVEFASGFYMRGSYQRSLSNMSPIEAASYSITQANVVLGYRIAFAKDKGTAETTKE